jgi:hypothetical protein
VNERNRTVRPEDDAREILLDTLQFYRAEHQSEELAVGAGDLAGDLNDPSSRGAIAYWFADNGIQLFIRLQCQEEVSISNTEVGDWPGAREIEYFALGIDQNKGSQIIKADDLVTQRLVRVVIGHFLFEVFAGSNSESLDALDHAGLHGLNCVKVAFHLLGEDQCYILYFALVFAQSAVAEIRQHDACADRDRHCQQDPAEDD